MTTKERLSLEAARMFSARGYHGTSIGDLAGALGIQKASVYSHITGKHDLLAEAALAGAVAFHAAQDAVPAGAPPAEHIRLALAAHLAVVSEQLDVAGVWLQEWRYLQGDARREFLRERHRYEQRVQALFADAVAAGELRADLDAGHAALSFLSLGNWAYEWLTPEHDVTREAHALATLLLEGMMPAAST
jgi:AcrR family transcriptional regulator